MDYDFYILSLAIYEAQFQKIEECYAKHRIS